MEPMDTYASMLTGTVEFFKTDKGFGFVEPDPRGDDVLVHISEVDRSGAPSRLPRQRVCFQTRADKRGRGPRAFNLAPID